jgi:alpha-glucosidase
MKKLLVLLPALLTLLAYGGPTPGPIPAPGVSPTPAPGTETTIAVVSPDGRLSFRLSSDNTDLLFTLLSAKQPLMLPSPLRFLLDGQLITGKARITGTKKYTIHESYPWLGAHSTAGNNCNGAEVRLVKNGLAYTLDVRVFNDGAAFRVLVPGADNAVRVPDEATVFRLPGESTLWYHGINGHYEDIYEKNRIAQLKEGTWVAPPATLKLPLGSYIAITEANLQGYSGMVLQSDGKNGLVVRMANHQPASHPYVLRYPADDVARLAKPATVRGAITTPWRAILVGKDLNTMVNNDMVFNLCPAPDSSLFPQGIKTAWIQPGRAVWKYLDGGGDGTPEVMKKFTDEASQLGFEYNILEGFWRKWTDQQLKDLVDYSRQKKVGIWLWAHSKDIHDPVVRKALFQHCHDLGVVGLKLDFFDHEAKEVIDLYDDILKETAAVGLLVDFHGSNKPTGLSRTWPNEMTREAVKGMEASKLDDRATHETTIPFTRLLAGPAEYTVVHFGPRRKNTSLTHQLASAVILGGAPMLTYAANPENLLASPAVDIIKKIPAAYDETVVLPGSEIGELAAFARRKGDEWFLAVMNGTASKKIRIPLSFLTRTNTALVASDEDSTKIKMSTASFSPGDTLDLDLPAGGGYLACLTPPHTGFYNVKEYGAKGDGVSIDGFAINKAIDAAAAAGGGTVYFPAGNYLSYTIRLKNYISLYIDQGATLIAAAPVNKAGYDAPEPNPFDKYQDYGHSHWKNSLIYGEGLHDISILGPGLIWGKNLTRSTNVPEGGGNKTIALKLCYNVTIRDVSVLHGGHFAILATGVDNLTIDNMKVDTDRDGFDIDCCKNVRVSNCTVNSPFDDGICLKSSFGLGYAKATENVTITNCQVSGYDEGSLMDGTFKRTFKKYSDSTTTGRIKMGTESNGGFKNVTISNCVFDYSRGLALETVDGGLLEDVSITNITMRDIVNSPIFIRLGARMRAPDTIPIGVCRRIILSDIVVYNADSRHGCIISGLPGHPIEDLQMSNIRIYFKGGGTADLAARKVPEFEKDYPEPYRFGKMPAYGFFLRHVKQLDMHDVQVSVLTRDQRPAFILDDVAGVSMHHVTAQQSATWPSFTIVSP